MSIDEDEDNTGHGKSLVSFSEATRDAVRDYEDKNGKPPEGEPWRLDVLKQWVIVDNPVRDYHVIVGPGG